ncbi:hypothetical protein ACRRTK_001521 [Alexandromys fortis]
MNERLRESFLALRLEDWSRGFRRERTPCTCKVCLLVVGIAAFRAYCDKKSRRLDTGFQKQKANRKSSTA